MSKPKIITIVGPTSSGKTNLAIEIAKRFNGEIISADSRQVYVGMNIGTGKVTTSEMDNIPHCLLDICEPTKTYSAENFKTDATLAITNILSRKHLPIIAGGSFFYIELLRHKMQIPAVPPNHELRAKLEKLSTATLFKNLQTRDPERAKNIDKHNRRRLIRAIEIIEAIGTIPAFEQTQDNTSPYDWLVIGINIDKEQLHQNIHTRLHERLNMGMIDEVIKLHQTGVSYQRMEELGLEYRYTARYLQNFISYDEMVNLLETKIKQYAKRQMTWLKRDQEIEWHSLENREAIFQRIHKFLT